MNESPAFARAAVAGVGAVVLDLDGTLIDSRQDIAAAANYVLVAAGREPLAVDTIAKFVGDGALALIQRASGLAIGDPELSRMHDAFREYYTAHAVVHTVTYPGVMSTLRAIRTHKPTVKLGLCTNKPRSTTERVLQRLQLDQLLDVVTAADDFEHKKPHPEPLLSIAKQLGLEPGQLLMVGDGPQDIECGKRAGALTAGVSYGIMSHAAMRAAGPDFELQHFTQLLVLLGIEQHDSVAD